MKKKTYKPRGKPRLQYVDFGTVILTAQNLCPKSYPTWTWNVWRDFGIMVDGVAEAKMRQERQKELKKAVAGWLEVKNR